MIPIAAVLMLIIIAFSVAVVVSNPAVFDLSIFGAAIPVTTSGVYFTGAGAMLVLVLALVLLRRGLKRGMARRRQVRALQNAAGVKSLPTTPRKDAKPSPTISSRSAPAATGPTKAGTAEVGHSGPGTVAPQGDDRQTEQARPTFGSQGKPDPKKATTTSAAERQAMLDQTEELTGDSSDR